jgi:hypothetical protein
MIPSLSLTHSALYRVVSRSLTSMTVVCSVCWCMAAMPSRSPPTVTTAGTCSMMPDRFRSSLRTFR